MLELKNRQSARSVKRLLAKPLAMLLAAALTVTFSPVKALAELYTLQNAETYTTQPGDRLNKIATRFGTTWQQLVRQNPEIKNPNLIYPGQVLDVKCYPSDYSNTDNWLRLPQTADKQVDVFYVYPTVYAAGKGEPVFAELSSTAMRTDAARVSAAHTAVFENACNVYAPFYRQISLTALSDNIDDMLGGPPATDITAAFDRFINNYNNGRPFIIAGQSQGSIMLLYLLSGYMVEHPEVYERMVVAYVIGFSVTEDYLNSNPHLKFAEGADDTGVIVSYNTEMPDMSAKNPVLHPGARAINPLNWKTDDTYAPAELNLGSLKVDAQINLSRGSLACSTVDPNDPQYQLPAPMFPFGCYHHCDYSFYGENLKQNALDRIEAFLNGK